MRRSRTVTLIALALTTALAGCVTTRVPADEPAARGVAVRTDGPAARSQSVQAGVEGVAPAGPSAPARAPSPDVLGSLEPCATRLQDVAGVMLLYYALHKQLPTELEQLREVADFDQGLEFTCPASGRPYVYEPAGLRYPGKDERLVLYDAEPTHDGIRWGVLAAPPKGKRPAAMWAVPLTREVFDAYLASENR